MWSEHFHFFAGTLENDGFCAFAYLPIAGKGHNTHGVGGTMYQGSGLLPQQCFQNIIVNISIAAYNFLCASIRKYDKLLSNYQIVFTPLAAEVTQVTNLRVLYIILGF